MYVSGIIIFNVIFRLKYKNIFRDKEQNLLIFNMLILVQKNYFCNPITN